MALEIRTSRVGEQASEGTRALWAAMRRFGWSQGDLAREAGTTSANVVRWLHGDRRPSLKWALRLEKVTGVKASLWDRDLRAPLTLKPTGTE